MSANKYIFGIIPIYEAIDNFVELKIHPVKIGVKMYNKGYRLEVKLHSVNKLMLTEFYQCLAEQAWYTKYRNHDYINNTKE